MDPIPFPFVPGGIDWAVTFSPPVIDLHPETPPAPPPEITLGPGQFTLHTGVQMCIACVSRGRGDDGQTPDKTRRRLDGVRRDATCFKLEVHALGHLELVTSTTGAPAVRLRLDVVEIVDIAPNDVESFLECLLRMVLDAALTQMELPLEALRAGAFSLTLVRGPEIEDDQVKVYGEV